MSLFLMILAALCLLYCLLLGTYVGFMTVTAMSWLVMSLVCAVSSALWRLLRAKGSFETMPAWIRTFLLTTAVLFLSVFVLTEFYIFRGILNRPIGDADYVIVLGARINGTVPSLSLKMRLDAAYDYAVQNPDCRVICSGARGEDEDISEAQAMFRYLSDRGLDGGRILRETESRSTKENLTHSLRLVEEGSRVVIATSDYHIFRALHMARNLREDITVTGLPARTPGLLVPHSLLREFLSVWKAKLLGEI